MDVDPLQHLFGRVAHSNRDLLFSLANLETKLLRKRLAAITIDRPIYICGLARAGTTILLELVAEVDETVSFRYKDYPFVMLPYWWGRFLAKASKPREPTERSHADGLAVTPDSPEAMEEILWMHFFPDCHNPAVNNALERDQRRPAFDTAYQATIRKLLLERGGSRYLAKENYNVGRLDYLLDLFPDARFVVPVRDPVWHIASLMKQHRLLSEEERKDKRVLAYMQQSGHFEFGLDLRPLSLGETATTQQVQALWKEGQTVKGWALYWRHVHTYLETLLQRHDKLAAATHLVPYERLCANSSEELQRLYTHLELDPGKGLIARQAARLHPPGYYEPGFSTEELEIIQTETADLHQRLIAARS